MCTFFCFRQFYFHDNLRNLVILCTIAFESVLFIHEKSFPCVYLCLDEVTPSFKTSRIWYLILTSLSGPSLLATLILTNLSDRHSIDYVLEKAANSHRKKVMTLLFAANQRPVLWNTWPKLWIILGFCLASYSGETKRPFIIGYCSSYNLTPVISRHLIFYSLMCLTWCKTPLKSTPVK